MTINWLLVFVPIAIVLEHLAPDRALWIFFAAALAIMPLAGWMGHRSSCCSVTQSARDPWIWPSSGGLVLTIVLAVWITGQVAGDGRSDGLRGVQLLAVYLILALVYLLAPGSTPQ